MGDQDYIVDFPSCKLRCALELGTWTPRSLDTAIRQRRADHTTPTQRLAAWARDFLGVPFQYETLLPPLPGNTLRVRLASFDCITLIYHLVALCDAESLDDFVRRLYRIRYLPPHNGALSNHPESGTLFDFGCESLLINCVERNILEDVTTHVAEGAAVSQIQMVLSPVTRPAEHDLTQTKVYPRYPGRSIDTAVIPSGAVSRLDPARLRSGDIVIFTRGSHTSVGAPQPCLVSHSGVLIKQGPVVGFIHATKNYYVRDVDAAEEPIRSRHLPGHPEKLLPGVAFAGEYLGDSCTIVHEGITYYGYRFDRARTLASYAENIFFGIKIFRPRSSNLQDAALDKSNQVRVAAHAHFGVNLFGISSR